MGELIWIFVKPFVCVVSIGVFAALCWVVVTQLLGSAAFMPCNYRQRWVAA